MLGVINDTEKRHSGKRSWQFDVKQQGWRYHMSNIMASIGSEQLKRFPEIAGKRQALAKLYDSLFENHSRIQPLVKNYETVVPHIYVVRIEGMKNRKILQSKLLEKGIQTGIHYHPNHRLSLYHNNKAHSLPVTEKQSSQLLTLPLSTDLTEKDVEIVAKTLQDLVV